MSGSRRATYNAWGRTRQHGASGIRGQPEDSFQNATKRLSKPNLPKMMPKSSFGNLWEHVGWPKGNVQRLRSHQGASVMDLTIYKNTANYMSNKFVFLLFTYTDRALVQLRKLRCLAQVTDEALLVDNPFLVDEAILVLVDESRRCLVT